MRLAGFRPIYFAGENYECIYVMLTC